MNREIYIYEVEEIGNLSYYESSYNKVSEEDHRILNTYEMPKTSVKVTKTWVDGPQEKPDAVFNLYKKIEGGEKEFVDTKTLASGETELIWEELDAVDGEENPYIYTVEEEEIPNYETNKKVTPEGFEFTNKYIIPKTNIDITKKWVNGPTNRPAITLELYKQIEGGEKEFVGQKLFPNGMTKFTWNNLDKTDKYGNEYIYTIEEPVVPDNYEKLEEGLNITNTYIIPKTSITGTKKWINGPEEKPDIQLQLLKDGEDEGEPVTLASGETEHTWNNLDKTDINGKEYKYTVKEVNTPENYTSDISKDGLTVKNKYKSPKTSITGEKVWTGGPEEKPTIEFELRQNGKPIDVKQLENGQTTVTWDDLDETDEKGNEYKYTVNEITYLKDYSQKIISDTKIENIFESEKTDVRAIKEWRGGPEEKPTVKFQLYKNIEGEDKEKVGEPVELENGDPEYIWRNLDKYNNKKIPYIYSVEEVGEVEDYETKQISDLVIRNVYKSPKTFITGIKEWVNGPEEKPDITFQLYRNGVRHREPVVLESGVTEHTWYELDKFDFNGEPYIYEVQEVEVPKEYGMEVVNDTTIRNTFESDKTDILGEKIWYGGPKDKPTIELQLYRNIEGEEKEKVGEPVQLENGKTIHIWKNVEIKNNAGIPYIYTVEEVEEVENYELERVNDHTVKNSYTSPKIKVTGEKIWEDGPEKKPDITLQLYANGVSIDRDPVVLKSGETKYTWEDLDEFDINGIAIKYQVFEIGRPENYGVEIVNDTTIKNKYKSPVTDILGEKIWEGGPEEKPDITLQLYRNIKGEKKEAYGDPVILRNGKTIHIWKNVEINNTDGVPYVYTVEEVGDVENYRKERVDDTTIKNIYESPKTKITGEKIWEGGPKDKPTIELQLYQNGKPYGKAVKLKSGDTKYTWKDLDKYDKHGDKYRYTIDEVNVPKDYGKERVDDTTIKNIYESPKVDITGTKAWENAPRDKPIIELQLYQNGKSYGSRMSIVSGQYSYTWKDLEKFDENGKEYVYTIDEVNVPNNYNKEVKGLTVVNTYEKPEDPKKPIKPVDPQKPEDPKKPTTTTKPGATTTSGSSGKTSSSSGKSSGSRGSSSISRLPKTGQKYESVFYILGSILILLALIFIRKRNKTK